MNSNHSDIVILGLICIALGAVFLVFFVLDTASKDKKKWYLAIALGTGVIAFALKIILIVTISSFPTQALELFPKKEYKKEQIASIKYQYKSANKSLITNYSWEALPQKAPAPLDNPTTRNKVALGMKLFNDKRLSFDNSISCASCHELSNNKGGGDGLALSIGINGQQGTRNAPSVFNAAFQNVFFWDGRADSLEEQAMGPILNPVEMGIPSAKVIEEKLSAIPEYQNAFAKVFTESPAISISNISKAIAAYERTLITPDSPYDRFINGEVHALSLSQKRGMALFESVGCVQCHSGPNFSGANSLGDSSVFRIFPATPNTKFESKYHLADDLGVVDGTAGENMGIWRIPSLRNVSRTAPYFHNGSVNSLTEAVKIMANIQLSKKISNKSEDDSHFFWSKDNKQIYNATNQALNDNEIDDIVAFLKALDGLIPGDKMNCKNYQQDCIVNVIAKDTLQL